MNNDDKEIWNELKEKAKIERNNLKGFVLNYMVENYEDDNELHGFIHDLLSSGCQSGIIGELIYYKDTNDFYDKFEDEIEELITENMEMLGVETRPLFINSLNGSAENMTQEKNLLSWFAFEETARKINEEFKINREFI